MADQPSTLVTAADRTPAGPEVSVILPMYNEAPMVGPALTALREALSGCAASWEIVCVDDGSQDGTGAALVAASRADPRVVAVQFSRNFGKEAALLCGLQAAQGQAVVLMDADLQHPPSLLPALLAKWKQGFDVVDAVKANRGDESAGYRLFAALFYGLLSRAVGKDMHGASDFKLLDRQVVDAVLACPERNRFFRGLVAWVGFSVAQVPFDVAARHAGTSKWSMRGLIRYALHNLVSFSSLPLKLVAWAGAATVSVGVLLGIQTLYNWLTGRAVSGFTTVILLLLMLCGLILLSLGVVAVYLAYLYEEQKARPVFVVRQPRLPVEPPLQ
jgi:dolichol-phosphate mannosyltransferase